MRTLRYTHLDPRHNIAFVTIDDHVSAHLIQYPNHQPCSAHKHWHSHTRTHPYLLRQRNVLGATCYCDNLARAHGLAHRDTVLAWHIG